MLWFNFNRIISSLLVIYHKSRLGKKGNIIVFSFICCLFVQTRALLCLFTDYVCILDCLYHMWSGRCYLHLVSHSISLILFLFVFLILDFSTTSKPIFCRAIASYFNSIFMLFSPYLVKVKPNAKYYLLYAALFPITFVKKWILLLYLYACDFTCSL